MHAHVHASLLQRHTARELARLEAQVEAVASRRSEGIFCGGSRAEGRIPLGQATAAQLLAECEGEHARAGGRVGGWARKGGWADGRVDGQLAGVLRTPCDRRAGARPGGALTL